MNKALAFLISALLVLCSGCSSISAEDYQNLQKENDSLRSEIESLKEAIDFYENGAGKQLAEASKAFENGEHEKVITITTQLHKDFPSSPEDKEAQELLVKSQAALDAKAAELALSAQERVREIIRVTSVRPSKPNSAGGVDLYVDWVNNSDKTIKYIVFVVEPYNAVGDIVKCDIRGESTFRGKETGPYDKGQGSKKGTYWECPWYNYSITRVELNQIEIEYMDSTKATITGDDVIYAQY